jgi:hypothetical protein
MSEIESLQSTESHQSHEPINPINPLPYLIVYEAINLYHNAKAKEYFQIVNTLDPNNKKAKDFLASPEGK